IRLRGKKSQASDVPAGAAKTTHQSGSHWIGRDGNNYWNCASCLLGGLRGGRIDRDDDIQIESDEFGSECAETIQLTRRISILDPDALSIDPPKVTQTLSECVYLS